MPPPLEIGRLDDRVTVQTLVETVDPYGQAVQDWSEGIEVWARVRPPTGREAVNADQLKVGLSHIVTMRYRANLDESGQVLHGDEVLRITYVRPDEMRLMMDLFCVRQAGETEADV